jgi:hypothetical protein
MYAAIYVKYLWDKMFYDAGYSYTSKSLDTDKFKNLLIPFTLDKMTRDASSQIYDIFRVGMSSQQFVPQFGDAIVEFNNESFPNGDPNGFWDSSDYTYNFYPTEPYNQRFGIVFNITYDGIINRPTYVPDTYMGLQLSLYRSFDSNGLTNSTWAGGYGAYVPTYNGLNLIDIVNDGSMPILVSTYSVGTYSYTNIKGQFYSDFLDDSDINHRSLKTGEKLRLVVSSNIGNDYNIETDTFIFNQLEQTILPGQTIEMNRTLPINIKQKDFFQSIVKMFNLYVETDKKNKNNLFIESRDDFYAGGQVKDWSNKVDFNSIQSYDILANTQDKTYLFKYKDDKDYFNQDYISKTNESYGQFKWEIDSDFKTSEKKMEVIFSPTPLTLVGGSTRFVIPKIYKLDNNAAKKTSSNIRIVTKTTNGLIDLQAGGTGSYTDRWTLNGNVYTSYPYVGHFDTPFNPTYDLNFGYLRGLYYSEPQINIGNTTSAYYPSSLITNNTLVNQYWAKFLSETMDKDSRIVYVNALLDPQDIYDFRFNDSIFIDLDGGGQYFKVNAIKDYNPGIRSLCKLELLKTKDLEITDVEAIISNNSGSNPNPITIHNLGNTTLSPGVIHNGIGNISSGIGNFVNGVGNVTAGPIISVNGANNIVGQGSENMFVSGNNNNVKTLAKRGNILGSNNTIGENISDVVIIGNDINATQNDTIYLSGKLVTAFNLVDAGTDIVLYPFQEISISNLIDASTDVVQQLGSYNTINLIDASTDSVL